MTNPEVCVLKTDGVGCDKEMAYAFSDSGASPQIVHVNELREGSKRLTDFGALAIPGGFSYGDDIASGKVFANELTTFLSDQLQQFVEDEKPILGVCNGDQVLVKTGLLPFNSLGKQQATLTHNTSGRFECRWVDLSVGRTVCKFVCGKYSEGAIIPMQIAHGEGRFVAPNEALETLEQNGQVVFRYADTPYSIQPYNPNGSMNDIAGICDPTGLILGMMPHPERSIGAFHPDRSRTTAARDGAQILFDSITRFAKES